MISLDLEWNRGYAKKPIEEILHIGAVKIDHLGGPIVDTFNSYIKPVIHAKMDIGARKLPQLDDYRELGTTFPRAMKVIMQRYFARFALISLHCAAHCDTVTELFLEIAIIKSDKQRAKADCRV